jgi:hypothetical protein
VDWRGRPQSTNIEEQAAPSMTEQIRSFFMDENPESVSRNRRHAYLTRIAEGQEPSVMQGGGELGQMARGSASGMDALVAQMLRDRSGRR